MLSHFELISRIAAGAALGGIIGFERDLHGRHVGLRTHLIVAMTSATFMVVSAHFVRFQGYDAGAHPEADVSRIAASVVSGIGFLAGGAILRTGATVQGLTTAAGLWLVTAIGLCAGAGMYPESIAVTVMGLIALGLLRRLEDKNDQMIRRKVSMRIEDGPDAALRILESIKGLGAVVVDFEYEKSVDDHRVEITADIRLPVTVGIARFVDQLEKHPGVHHLRVQLPG